MSMPTSAIACTATGLIRSAGSEPAERTSTVSPASCRSQPAAICERPALCTQTNRTLGLSLIDTAFPVSDRWRGQAVWGLGGVGVRGMRHDNLGGGPAGVRIHHDQQ